MSEHRSRQSPSRRDRALRRVRRGTWAIGAGTAGLATTLSVVSAHAFKGHSHGAAPAPAPKQRQPLRRVAVPGPQHVPAIAHNPAPLQPPSAPPSATPAPAPTPSPAPAPTPAPAPAPAPVPQPQPQTSGGS
jgi:outer membrane biosynthesis protein TonB